MNKVILIGRLTRDPEIRKTQSGKSTATFSLAVDRRKKDSGADFPECVAWEKIADLLGQYVKKGHKVGITGHLQTRTYDDKKGQKRFVTEVIVDELEFLETKNKSVFEEPKPAPPDFAMLEDDDNDLPF